MGLDSRVNCYSNPGGRRTQPIVLTMVKDADIRICIFMALCHRNLGVCTKRSLASAPETIYFKSLLKLRNAA